MANAKPVTPGSEQEHGFSEATGAYVTLSSSGPNNKKKEAVSGCTRLGRTARLRQADLLMRRYKTPSACWKNLIKNGYLCHQGYLVSTVKDYVQNRDRA